MASLERALRDEANVPAQIVTTLPDSSTDSDIAEAQASL